MAPIIISKILGGIILSIFILTTAEPLSTGSSSTGSSKLRFAHRGRSRERGGRYTGGKDGPLIPNNINKQELLKNITTALNSQPKEVLIDFFTVMKSAEAQKQLKVLKVDPATIDQLLVKLKGTDQQVAEAKQTITTYITGVNTSQVTKKQWKAAVKLMMIYTTYRCKQDLKKAVAEDSVETLRTGLTSLAAIESYMRFRGIVFRDLLNTLSTGGDQGRKQVTDKLNQWIDTADPQTLTKAAIIYSLATKGPKAMTTPPPSGLPTSPLPGQSTTPSAANATTPGVPPSSTTPRKPE